MNEGHDKPIITTGIKPVTIGIRPVSIFKGELANRKIFESILQGQKILNETLGSFTKMVESIISDIALIPIEDTTDNISQLLLYVDSFRKENIIVDSSLLNHVKNKYGSYLNFEEDKNASLNPQQMALDEIIETSYFLEQDTELQKIKNIDKNHDLLVSAIINALDTSQYIAATSLCHTLLDSLLKKIKQKLSDKNIDLLKAYKEDPVIKWEIANDRKIRLIIAKAFSYNEDKLLRVPVDFVEEITPLIMLAEGLKIYENKKLMSHRNDIIHFNENVDFETLDRVSVMKLLQIVKIAGDTDKIFVPLYNQIKNKA